MKAQGTEISHRIQLTKKNSLDRSAINNELPVSRESARPNYEIRPPSILGFNLLANLSKLRQYKDLVWTLSLHRIKVRYKQSVLGILWAFLQPISMMLVFTFIFSLIARMPSDGIPYSIFAFTALLPWNYFSTSVANGTSSLVKDSQFVTKVYFPREILPITYIVAALFDFAIALILLACLMIYYHVALTVNVLYVVPILLVLTCFALAISLMFSATQVRFRDIGMAVPLLLQLWLFATPVIYPLSAVPARWRSFYELNPMVGIIESFRQVVLKGEPPDMRSLMFSAVVSVILLFVSYLYFKRVEATMADFV